MTDDNYYGKAIVLKPDGTSEEKLLGKDTLKSLQDMVGGFIEQVYTYQSNDNVLLVNEEGRILGLEHNPQASNIALQPLVGNAVLLNKKYWD
jgi:hypothetical protein